MTSTQVVVFLALTSVQVALAIVYKIAQTNGQYEFSPASALVLAEIFKTIISASLLFRNSTNDTWRGKFRSSVSALRETTFSFRAHTVGLAFSYAVNNQLGFAVFLFADPASITLFKSGSSFISALILLYFFGRRIFALQWAAIGLQVTGLIATLYDPCEEASVLPPLVYALLIAHFAISCVNGVWNEYLVKNFSVNLHAQNVLLYISGSILNLIIYLAIPGRLLGTPSNVSFFHGYTPSAWLVVFMNSIIGIVIVAVYKYANVLVKTFGLACATGILYFISYVFFGWSVTPVGGAGALSVFLASFVYFNSSIHDSTEKMKIEPDATPSAPRASRRVRVLFVLVCSVLLAVTASSFFPSREIEIADHSNPMGDRCNRCLDWPGFGWCNSSKRCMEGSRDRHDGCPADQWMWGACHQTSPNSTYFNDMLVIIYFNSNHPERIPLLRGWAKVFPNLLFTGNLVVNTNQYPDVFRCEEGGTLLWYRCIVKVMETYPEYDGYLGFHFDAVINYWNFPGKNISRNLLWQSWGGPMPPDQWHWPWNMETINKITVHLNQTGLLPFVHSRLGSEIRRQGFSDIHYVPRRFVPSWTTWAKYFSSFKLFHEVALPIMAHLVVDDPARDIFDFYDGAQFQAPNQSTWEPQYNAHHKVDLTINDGFLVNKIWNGPESWQWSGRVRVPKLKYPVRKWRPNPSEAAWF